MKMLKKMIVASAFGVAAMAATSAAQAACYIDNYNYKWELSVIDDTATHTYFAGTMTNASGTFGGAATHTKGTNFVTVGSDFGTSFQYSLQWGLSSGSGVFINNTSTGGHGPVTSFAPCGTAAATTAVTDGPAPGM